LIVNDPPKDAESAYVIPVPTFLFVLEKRLIFVLVEP